MPAGHDDLGIFRLNGLRSQGYSLQTGAANLVHRHGPDLRRRFAVYGGLPGGVLSQAGGDNVAHDALVHLIQVLNAGALHGFADNDGAKLGGAEVGERALKLSNGCANTGDDHHVTGL